MTRSARGWNPQFLREACAVRLMAVVHQLAALLTPKRVVHYPLLLLIASFGIYAVSMVAGEFPFDTLERPFTTDFSARMAGGRIALNGDLHRLYQADHQWEVQQDLLGNQNPDYLNLFISPPVDALIYAPFALMPYFPAALLWLICSIVFLLLSLRLLWPLVPALHRFRFRHIAIISLSAPPVVNCLQSGQNALLTVLVFSASIRCLVTGKDIAGGVVLGLGMYKPQLVILFPVVLLVQRRWRALASFTGVSALLTAISVTVLGWSGVRDYLALLSSDVYLYGIAEAGSWNMQSLAPVLRSIAPQSAWRIVDGLILLGGIALLALVSHKGRIAGRTGPQAELQLYGFTILVTALVDPHFFIYDCSILLLPALLLIASNPISDGIKVTVAALFLFTMAAGPLHLLASRVPVAVSIVDTQWSVLPIILMTWFTWKAIVRYEQRRPPGPASTHASFGAD